MHACSLLQTPASLEALFNWFNAAASGDPAAAHLNFIGAKQKHERALVHRCTHTHAHTHTRTRAHTHTHTHTHTNTHHTHTHTHTYAHTHTCTHTHSHTYTPHAHTHTLIHTPNLLASRVIVTCSVVEARYPDLETISQGVGDER